MIGKIFVSHSSQDKEIADKVISYLELNNQVCWIAPRDIPPGADWAESILDGIDTASGMILIVSPVINDSPHIRREVERAVSNRIPIYPIITKEFQYAKWIQYYISAHQWIDASNCNLDQVLQQIIIILEPNSNKLNHQLNEVIEPLEVPELNPSEGKDKRISLVDNSKSDTSGDKYKRRYQLVRNTFIWFFIGCGITIPIYRIQVFLNENLVDKIDNILLLMSIYGLAYGLTGFTLSIFGEGSYRKRFILSSIAISLISTVVPSLLEYGNRGWFIEGVEFAFLISPLVLIVGLIVAGLLTLLEKWMRH